MPPRPRSVFACSYRISDISVHHDAERTQLPSPILQLRRRLKGLPFVVHGRPPFNRLPSRTALGTLSASRETRRNTFPPPLPYLLSLCWTCRGRSKRTVITLQSMPCRRRPKTCRRRWRVYGKCSRNRWRLPNTPQSRSSLAPDRPRPPHFVFRCFFCTGIQQCTGREAMVGWGAVLNMLFSWFSF